MDAFDTTVANGLKHVKLRADAAELPGISAQLGKTAAHYDRSGAFPHENFALLHQHGLIGLVAARELAGEPLTLPEAREIIAAVALGEPSTALVLIMTYLFVFQAARNPNWPPALLRHVLEDIAINGALACLEVARTALVVEGWCQLGVLVSLFAPAGVPRDHWLVPKIEQAILAAIAAKTTLEGLR